MSVLAAQHTRVLIILRDCLQVLLAELHTFNVNVFLNFKSR